MSAPRAYYNEIDPYAAQWLRNLIAEGLIAGGEVDERSIADVRAHELVGFTQCHFFAGIAGWSHALRLAGWPDDRPVWTGSCPCQPFSAAGKGGGFDDERHLWPHFFRLIGERRPPVVFGEQVASPAGLEWLDLVQADMEGAGYAFAAVDCCSAGVGAPHIRQRIGFVGHTSGDNVGRFDRSASRSETQSESERQIVGDSSFLPGSASATGRLAYSDGAGRRQVRCDAAGDLETNARRPGDRSGDASSDVQSVGLADADDDRRGADAGREFHDSEHHLESRREDDRPGPTNGFWRDPDWLLCRDGKWRPVESGTFPLAHGISGRVELVRSRFEGGTEVQETRQYSRVGALRGYGNAINPHQFAAFIGAYLST